MITRDPDIMDGVPVMEGTRIPVSLIMRIVANSPKAVYSLIACHYPHLKSEQIIQMFEDIADEYDYVQRLSEPTTSETTEGR